MKRVIERSSVGILSAACVAAGCASASNEIRVASVNVAGNDRIPEDPIEAGLVTRDPEGLIFKKRAPYDPLAITADIERIEGFYARRGYFDAAVTDVDVEKVNERAVSVRFYVREGLPTRVSAVKVAGAPREAASPLQEGEVLNYFTYEEVKDEIRQELILQGHVYAEVEGTIAVDRERHLATVTLEVDAGPKVYFGTTRVEGLERVPDSTVLGRLAWEPGDLVTPERLATTRGRLQRLGVFGTVNIDFVGEDGEAARAAGRRAVGDVVVRVSEAPRREVRLGGGLAYDDANWEVRARAGYRRFGFLTPLTELWVEARPAYRILRSAGGRGGFGGEALAQLTQHDLFVPRLTGTARLAYERFEIEAYGQEGPQARLAVGKPFFGDALFLNAAWQLEYLSFFEVHPSLAEELSGRQRIGFFSQSARLDRRNDLLDPSSGYYLELSLEEGQKAAGGEFDYVRGVGEARGYVPLAERVVAAARARYGEKITGDLPVPQRFFSGGATSHRGFAQRRLSPVGRAPGERNVPIGGEQLAEVSAELRVDVAQINDRWFGLVGFVDGGDVTGVGEEIDYGNLHWAVGLGVRYNTIVGPIRADIGYRVNRTGVGEPQPGDHFAIHFSLGEAF